MDKHHDIRKPGAADPARAIEVQDGTGGLPARAHSLESLTRLYGAMPRPELRSDPSHAAIMPSSTDLPRTSNGDREYEVLGRMGAGRRCEVFKARDVALGRFVALKVLKADSAWDSEVVRAFVASAQTLSQLQHPGVPVVHDVGLLADERPFVALEMINGRSLDASLAQRRPNSVTGNAGLDLFERICQVLAYAHSRGVVHCSLTPANIFVGPFGGVQLLGWGIARVVAVDAASAVGTVRTLDQLSRDDVTVAHPAYLSPEQALGATERIGERTDVFALGALLCQILTGEAPYTGSDKQVRAAAAQGRLDGAMRRLDECDAEPEFVALAKVCLAPTPSARPQNGHEVLKAYQECRASIAARQQDTEVRAWNSFGAAVREQKRARTSRVLSESLLLAGLVGGSGYYWHERTAEEAQQQALAALHEEVECTQFLWSQARSSTAYDGEMWEEALLASSRTGALLSSADIDESTRLRVEYILENLKWEHESAHARDRERADDAQLLARLADLCRPDLRGPSSSGYAWYAQQYAQVFRAAGLHPEDSSVQDVAERVVQRAIAPALAGAFDEWALALHESVGEWTPEARELIEVAVAADPDAQREALRHALVSDDSEGILASFEAMDLASAAPSTARLMALALRANGHMDWAVQALKVAQARHPDDFLVNSQLAWALEMVRPPRPDEAARFYTVALALRPRSVEVRCRLAGALAERLDYDGALEALAPALAEGGAAGTDAHVLTLMGEIHAGMGDEGRAIAYWREAVQVAPQDPEGHRRLANHLAAAGDAAGARDAWETVVRLVPDDVEGHLALGILLSDYLSDPSGAMASLNRALELAPESVDAHTQLARVALRGGDQEGAVALLFDAVRLSPGHAGLQSELGRALLQQGDLEGAAVALRESLLLRPGDRDTAELLLELYQDRLGDLSRAVSVFEELDARSGGVANVRRMLGCALFAQGEFARTVAILEPLAADSPADLRLCRLLGHAYVETDQPEKAVVALERALELDPSLVALNDELARARLESGDIEGATRLARSVLETDRDDPEAHFLLGRALQSAGALDEAEQHLRETVRLWPAHAAAHCALGALLQERGDYSGALAAFRMGHAHGMQDEGWHEPSGEWVAEAERLVAMQDSLESVRRGGEAQGTGEDKLALAVMARQKDLNGTSAKLFAAAIEQTPRLVDKPALRTRIEAARAAALAGCGHGVDAADLDESTRQKWRRVAFDWLGQELEVQRGRLADGERLEVARAASEWLASEEFAGVRDEEALGALPATERARWSAFWAEVRELAPPTASSRPGEAGASTGN